jgi:hypothetical protein
MPDGASPPKSAESACSERRALEMKVAEAVADLYAAKGDARAVARNAERAAVKALDDHIKAHGCKNPGERNDRPGKTV